MSNSKIAINLEALFLLLGNATMCIPEKHRDRVFQDMAYKLMEWYDVSRVELRKAFDNHGIVLEELCHECNTLIQNRLVNRNDTRPLCEECSKT